MEQQWINVYISMDYFNEEAHRDLGRHTELVLVLICW